jgi:hypothetical protein
VSQRGKKQRRDDMGYLNPACSRWCISKCSLDSLQLAFWSQLNLKMNPAIATRQYRCRQPFDYRQRHLKLMRYLVAAAKTKRLLAASKTTQARELTWPLLAAFPTTGSFGT